MTEHKHIFHLGFLNYHVEVILTDNIAVSRRTYDEQVGHPYEDIDNTTGLHSCNKQAFISYIFICPDSEVTTITHEAFHAVVRVCSVFEIPLKSSTEEVYAYMLDFIIGEIVEFKESVNQTV